MGHPHKMKKMKKRAAGGKAEPEYQYNAKGSPEEKVAHEDKDDGFKKGGKAKMKNGGHVEGHETKKRLDKRARGGAMKGRSPMSSAHADSGPEKGNQGHMGDMPSEVD
jgi:hypothetical protein